MWTDRRKVDQGRHQRISKRRNKTIIMKRARKGFTNHPYNNRTNFRIMKKVDQRHAETEETPDMHLFRNRNWNFKSNSFIGCRAQQFYRFIFVVWMLRSNVRRSKLNSIDWWKWNYGLLHCLKMDVANFQWITSILWCWSGSELKILQIFEFCSLVVLFWTDVGSS